MPAYLLHSVYVTMSLIHRHVTLITVVLMFSVSNRPQSDKESVKLLTVKTISHESGKFPGVYMKNSYFKSNHNLGFSSWKMVKIHNSFRNNSVALNKYKF